MMRAKRIQRHYKIRHTISGTSERPRLSVYRGNRHLFIQLIDDTKQATLFGISSNKLGEKISGRERAKKVAGQIIGYAQDKGIRSFVFDRGGFRYHGQIKEIADAIRAAGIQI
jgi:large subunit ribosomal protein L18